MPPLLLDTHALVWWVTGHERLSTRARRAIETSPFPICLSAVSAYEIALQQRLGRLPEDLPVLPFGADTGADVRWLPIQPLHAFEVGRLPLDHRDPWDRLLACQARLERLALVTADPAFERYGLTLVW